MTKQELHLRAPGNWINDPNGFIYSKGRYHLFYQFFPYAPVWGTMHWGHAVSDDLIHWEHLGVALFPTKDYDQNGVFSGSALEKDGEMYLYYSAVKYLESDRENIHMAKDNRFETSQAMVISKDGIHFDNWKDKKQIIPVNQNEDQAHPTHTRDPKVWKDGDTYYMVLGSTYREEVGRAVFYTSHDGINWKFKNQVQDKRFGRILECPDIFEVDGVHVFEGSAMYIADGSCGYENHAICATAEFDREQCNLRLTGEVQYVDYGMDLYAPQTNLDHEGRRVMIAWMRMPQPVTEAEGIKWNGMMCLPRVVEVENGHVCYRVHPEVRKYFNEVAASSQEWNPLEPFCIKVCLEEGEKLNIGGYQIQRCDRRILTDRSKVFADLKEYALTAKSPKVSGECRLEIFVDRNLVEIYINDGEYVISQVVYGLTDIIEVETDKNNITYLRHNSDR
ncbi:glycoside hydrolase family 32 protein [Lachnospiraceae bacterium HCP28S3_F9]|uniref:glycoside hydrolase family 32 protein n=1 Tax=Lachnospiraceae TaxID=186803 RepID=UPI002A8A371A|nr:glycoside hydrolase family 32 protein [Lachnospiraceae bacterium]MDY4207120.1 glycoside hydrolase family 32 protein [Lachnospiraceae bacterium]